MLNKTYNTYLEYLEQLPIKQGEPVYIISNMAPVFYSEKKAGRTFSLDTFIQDLKHIFYKDNTILIPTFNWDFCKGLPFDYRYSKSQAGILGDYALKDKDFKRTKHPIYSYAVYGKDKEILVENDFIDSFGDESVFHYLYYNNAAQIGIGTNTYTAHHFIEEHFFKDIIPYRYIKVFKSEYIDEYGKSSIKEYSMFVRKLELNTTVKTEPFRQELIDTGIVERVFINQIPYYFTHVEDYCNYAKNDIEYNKSRKLVYYDGRD